MIPINGSLKGLPGEKEEAPLAIEAPKKEGRRVYTLDKKIIISKCFASAILASLRK